MDSGLIYAVTVVGTIAGSYVVARVGAKVSQRATDTTAALTHEANVIAEKADAMEGLGLLVKGLQDDLARVRADHEALRRDHNRLNEHVKALEQERVKDKTLIRHLIAYARLLIESLRKAGMPVPEAPAGLDVDGTL